MERKTTRQFVIDTLRLGPTCANIYYRNAYPTARNRISELRAEGWVIDTEVCDYHEHANRTVMYRLRSEPV